MSMSYDPNYPPYDQPQPTPGMGPERYADDGLPISPVSQCWPHRWEKRSCSICAGRGCNYCAQSGSDPYHAKCKDCGASKCHEPGCEHVAGDQDLCPKHEMEDEDGVD